MPAPNSETLAHHRQEMESTITWASSMLRALEREQLSISHVRHHDGPAWFVRVVLPQHLQEGFGLAPEMLVIAVNGEVYARTIHQANIEVVRSQLRLDGNLVIVADRGPKPAERLERIGGHGHRVAWTEDAPGRWPSLVDVLRKSLPAFDAFEERDAVRGAQLVGRDEEVAELRTRVVRGDAVGLFGLRKMGKTSVMRAVTDWFDPASAVRDGASQIRDVDTLGEGVAVVIDASTLIDRTVDAVSDELNAALRRRMKAAGEAMTEPAVGGLAEWKRSGERVLEEGRRLCIVIDEFDLLFEGEGGDGAVPGIGKLFRLVRGWAQTRQGCVSLILVGRDPTYLSAPEIDGVTSPLTAWLTPTWLGPLTRNRATELLRKLGRRVGLDIGSSSANLALQWTGGHPLLHRQFGSALRTIAREASAAWGASTDEISTQTPPRFMEREGVLDVMREIVALLHKRYPTALEVLHELARGETWEVALAKRDGVGGGAARILQNFGLVTAAREVADGLSWYLTRASTIPDTARKTA